MTDVKASDVKALRERTGAGMMDCKKALTESNGSIEDAIDILRKKGLSAAAKKSGRITAEGLVGLCVKGKVGALIEVNAETDFVARNELFRKYVADIAEMACDGNDDAESLKTRQYPGTGRTVSEELTNLIAVIGENMGIRRIARVSVSDGVTACYVHNKIAENLGKIGILVALESSGDKGKLADLGKKIAMHVAAADPRSISRDDLDPALLKREKDVITERTKATGKPAEFIEKIVAGRIQKFYEEVVLTEQVFVMDGSVKVKDVVAGAEKEIGAPIKIKSFVKFVLGEGIEKSSVNFADEVAAQLTHK
ncbi:MAG: translation elongation factor Ts [Holosporaceae bacterium]|jgi:elongation factor Ts|nr:translation elongation factor Ts [Holosporaceae bacterium]